MMRIIALCLVTLALVAEPPISAERQARTGLIDVVGLWSAVTDGGPAFHVDGAKWSGKTDASQARALATQLFGSVSDKFISNMTADGAFPLAVWQDTASFTGGTLQTQFKLVSGATDQTAGIVFNLQPTGEYFFLRYNTKDGNVALWIYADGQRKVVKHGEAHAQLQLGAWHTLTVTVAGTKVTGTIKAATPLTVDHTLDKPVSGRVGLWTKRDSVTTFRQFSVTR